MIRKTKKLCGDDFPVIVKLSVMELGKKAGISIFEGMYYAYAAQRAGADALEILAGAWNETAGKKDRPETGQAKGLALPLCSLVKRARTFGSGKVNLALGKKAVTIPLVGGGRSFEPEIAEKALESGKCEFVFMGRGILAEPDLPQLIREGRFAYARPCIGCNQCINEQLQYRQRIGCAGCAVMGLGDNDYTIPPAEKEKTVAIIGGGPAGCEAARMASMRGHDVTLFEREGTIDDQINLAVLPPYKENIVPVLDYYKRQLDLRGVKVKLNTEVTKETLEQMSPDTVIFATGSRSAAVPIPGADKPIVLSYRDILKGKETGKRVVIIGGGTIWYHDQ